MADLLNVCSFTSGTSGTGDFTDASAVQGYLNLADAGAVNGKTYSYRAENATRTEWEVGYGVYNSGTGKLTRTPLKSSNGDAAVNFGTAPTVMITALSADLLTPAAIGTTVQPYDASLFAGIPYLSAKSADYTAVMGDANSVIPHSGADNNARTFTIPANASVAFPVGTFLCFHNGANTLTIAITSDTLMFMGSGATGSRTLAANGFAVALKVSSTIWLICGVGLS